MIAGAAVAYGLLAIVFAETGFEIAAIVCGAIWAYLTMTALRVDDR